MPTAAELGLTEVAPPPPGGAISQDHAAPSDVMEAPAFAWDGVGDPPDPQAPGTTSFLNPLGTTQTAGVQAQGTTQTAQRPGPAQIPVTATGAIDWDEVERTTNPRAGAQAPRGPDPVAQIRSQLASLNTEAELAYAQLVAAGMDPAQAQQTVTVSARAANAQLNQQLTEAVAAPAVTAHVAADIAKRFSLPGLPLSASDLAGEATPSAMMARARALQEGRRDGRVATRASTRVDTAELSSGTNGTNSPGTTRQLSPFETIKSGLRRR